MNLKIINGKLVKVEEELSSKIEKEVSTEFAKVKPFLTDTAKRALHAFWQTLLPVVGGLLTATSFSDAKTLAFSAATAAGSAALSLIKSAILAKLQGAKSA